MHIHSMDQWRHAHDFCPDHAVAEKGVRRVMALTAAMMVVEIIAGSLFGSMALLADGWHMATHVAAFGITIFAYRYARRHAHDPRFTFGTGKVSTLGGFASAVALAVVAFVMAIESVGRFLDPQTIRFNEAIAVAVLGLIVNLISGLMLKEHHDHHDTDHVHHHHHDHNLRAAYMHVLADALTSVFAVIALIAGKYLGWLWLDPVMGLVGALVISRWAYGLMRDTSGILLDGVDHGETAVAITAAIEQDADNRVADLHAWRVGGHDLAATLSIVTHYPRPPGHYKDLLRCIPHLVHVVVEVNACPGEPCMPVSPALV
jgi:cation diffusion facilitator family transporter